jgi:hypothetical protein
MTSNKLVATKVRVDFVQTGYVFRIVWIKKNAHLDTVGIPSNSSRSLDDRYGKKPHHVQQLCFYGDHQPREIDSDLTNAWFTARHRFNPCKARSILQLVK